MNYLDRKKLSGSLVLACADVILLAVTCLVGKFDPGNEIYILGAFVVVPIVALVTFCYAIWEFTQENLRSQAIGAFLVLLLLVTVIWHFHLYIAHF